MMAHPEFLNSLSRWVLWREETAKGSDRKTKIPYALTGYQASSTDPSDWMTYEAALAAHTRSSGAFDGLGITFGDLGNNEVLAGLDLDQCIIDGVLTDWAKPYLRIVQTYAEISPSSTGLKLFFRVRAADLADARRALSIPDDKNGRKKTYGPGVHPPAAEIYLSGRYFTVTGRHWPEMPADVALIERQTLADLGAAMGPRETLNGHAPDMGPRDETTPDAAELRRKLSGAMADSPLLAARWIGGDDGLTDASRSGRDMSVGSILKGRGFTFGEMRAALHLFPYGRAADADDRYFERIWTNSVAKVPPPAPEPPPEPEDEGYWLTLFAPLEAPPQDAEVCGSPAEVDPAQPPHKSSVIDPRTWTAPAPIRKWLIDGWIPIGYVTGLYGDGAVGKSLLAQQLLTSTAIGHPWLGLPLQRGPAFGFMCEDDPDELHRRQEGINRVYGIKMSMLELLRYSSRVGFDNLLMTFDERNRAQPTDLMAAIGTYLAKFRPRLVVLDTLSDIFGGDEIKRAHARMFVQGVGGKIAREFDCAVVIAAHPSLAGLQSGKGTGGSTAWNNTFRSRLYMTHPDEEGNSENRILSRMKANYAPKQGEITMRWDNGCFVEVATTKASDGMQWPEIKAIFDEIDRKWKERDPWSNAPQTRREGRYLPLWAFTTFGLPEKVTAKYLEGWLTSGHLRVAECDGRSKRKGLRVANWLTPSREDDHDWE